MRQQVPTGFRQSRFEYQMKIVLSRRHLASNGLEIEDIGYRRPIFPLKIFLKSRLRQGNQGPYCNHPHRVPACSSYVGKASIGGALTTGLGFRFISNRPRSRRFGISLITSAASLNVITLIPDENFGHTRGLTS